MTDTRKEMLELADDIKLLRKFTYDGNGGHQARQAIDRLEVALRTAAKPAEADATSKQVLQVGREIERATIERCAKVAEANVGKSYWSVQERLTMLVEEIRSLPVSSEPSTADAPDRAISQIIRDQLIAHGHAVGAERVGISLGSQLKRFTDSAADAILTHLSTARGK